MTSRGFDFTPNEALFVCNAGLIGNNTSAALLDANLLSDITMTRNGGTTFTMQSFFAGARTSLDTSVPTFRSATGMDVTGFLAAGGSVFEHFDFVGVDWTQFLVSSLFHQALTAVRFTAVGPLNAEFLIDDIVVDETVSVPEPGALGLLVMGLLGLAYAGHRRAVLLAKR